MIITLNKRKMKYSRHLVGRSLSLAEYSLIKYGRQRTLPQILPRGYQGPMEFVYDNPRSAREDKAERLQSCHLYYVYLLAKKYEQNISEKSVLSYFITLILKPKFQRNCSKFSKIRKKQIYSKVSKSKSLTKIYMH